jgi:hypothetical protein
MTTVAGYPVTATATGYPLTATATVLSGDGDGAIR